jgi:hypothetical protein
MRVIERVTVGKRGDGTLIRVEGQANWYSVLCVRGKQHEISTGTPDLKLAKRVHRQKLDELAEAVHDAPAPAAPIWFSLGRSRLGLQGA